MPFLQPVSIQIAGNHFSRPMGESSRMVPTLSENFCFGCLPEQKYTFGTVKAAQARGDFQVLVERGRRALRVHLPDVESGLAALASAVEKALV